MGSAKKFFHTIIKGAGGAKTATEDIMNLYKDEVSSKNIK